MILGRPGSNYYPLGSDWYVYVYLEAVCFVYTCRRLIDLSRLQVLPSTRLREGWLYVGHPAWWSERPQHAPAALGESFGWSIKRWHVLLICSQSLQESMDRSATIGFRYEIHQFYYEIHHFYYDIHLFYSSFTTKPITLGLFWTNLGLFWTNFGSISTTCRCVADAEEGDHEFLGFERNILRITKWMSVSCWSFQQKACRNCPWKVWFSIENGIDIAICSTLWQSSPSHFFSCVFFLTVQLLFVITEMRAHFAAGAAYGPALEEAQPAHGSDGMKPVMVVTFGAICVVVGLVVVSLCTKSRRFSLYIKSRFFNRKWRQFRV